MLWCLFYSTTLFFYQYYDKYSQTRQGSVTSVTKLMCLIINKFLQQVGQNVNIIILGSVAKLKCNWAIR